jgi:serine/threonine-protein kinase HipA
VTSKSNPVQECYIFVDQGESPILAARYRIDADGLGSLIYGDSYADRSDSFAFDPINLPWSNPLRVMHPVDGKASYGVLSDATPDNWGRKLMQSLHSRPPLNDIEWLLSNQREGVGCLFASLSRTAVKADREVIPFSDLSEFISLAGEYEAVGKKRTLPTALLKLLDFGTSMGGARPKTLVMHEGKEWIAKINRKDDLFDNARIEYVSLLMAREAGIHACKFHSIGHHSAILVERFDRNCPERKKHYISAHSLLNIPKVNPTDLSRNYSIWVSLVWHGAFLKPQKWTRVNSIVEWLSIF